jgi:asparagine synthase (glutamine-hydrolysing)
MTSTDNDVAARCALRGTPRFTDPTLAHTLAERGPEAAWNEGFARLGPEVVKVVEGEFSVFIEDARGRCFAAVDRFASHPLCYRFDAGRLMVAERADSIARPGTALDSQAIFDYLYFHVIPSPRTVFTHVARLPPGHFALAENGTLVIRRWWNPLFIENLRPGFQTLREEFVRLLRQAVSEQLGGHSVGCFLSGGTDSSTVAGLVKEKSGRAQTFSIGFDAPGYDEMQYARIAARHFDTRHHEYYVRPDDIVDAIPGIAASYDQPFGNSSVLPAYFCAKMAREHGVERLLAGDGGDELFGGNSRYAKQRLFELYGSIYAPLRRRVIEPLTRVPQSRGLPGFRKFVSYVEQAKTPLPDRLDLQNLLLHLGLGEVFAPDFLAAIDTAEPARQQRQTYAASTARSTINRMLEYDWKFTLADNDLPKVRGATAHAGVDVAFPLLDPRLVDFSLRLAPELKLRRLKLRWFFKEALRGFLPDAILTKRKHGFGLPFGVWLTTHTRLRELAFDSLRSLASRRIVRGDFIARLTDDYVREHPGYYGELVWILMVLELWMSARETVTHSRAFVGVK